MRTFNTLSEPILRVECGGLVTRLSLPGILAALMRDEVASFPGLRAHQRHAWHAFLVQLGAMALQAAKEAEPPTNEAAWATMLAALAPGQSTAFCLIAPADRPALLQPPIPDGPAALTNRLSAPDELDMLITSKNHDLKQAVMGEADAEDWLFALLTLQTAEGFLGAGNYGISRMNGGFGNRPSLGIIPPGGPGSHVRRDLRRLLDLRDDTIARYGYAEKDGLGLLWLLPWNGTDLLPPSRLDPWYIEICRRTRLVHHEGRIEARVGGSKTRRILETPGGLTGDPWAPLVADKDGGRKVLTLDAGGFNYRRMVGLMFPAQDGLLAPLQRMSADDPAEGLVLSARALVRGQGKTEGYHERLVPISRVLRRRIIPEIADPAADTAHARVKLAGTIQNKVLKPALMALFENGPERIKLDNDGAGRKAARFLSQFDIQVDRDFFTDLWHELEAADVDAGMAERRIWVRKLVDLCGFLLNDADQAGGKSTQRRYRARVRADQVLHGAARREVGTYLTEPGNADTAH